jgi:tRNA acetyltransferase TAN1
MYDIKSVHDTGAPTTGNGDDDAEVEEDDIEAAIRKEVAALTSKPTTSSSTTAPHNATTNSNRMVPVNMNVDCLLNVKTRPPVDPVVFVKRIVEDARRCDELPGVMRCRYVNRLTPVSVMGRANETGLGEVAREVLGRWFELADGPKGEGEKGVEGGKKGEEEKGKAKAEATESSGAPAADVEKKAFTVSLIIPLLP